MELEGSCHCEKVKFTVTCHAPVPYMYCYCTICLKCQGGGGYSINIKGDYETLDFISGKEHIKEYRAIIDKENMTLGEGYRYFCGECGSHLYLYNPTDKLKDEVYPFASAIDTPLPVADKNDIEHIMYNYKLDWVPKAKNNNTFKEYSELTFDEWHKEHGKYVESK